MKRQSVFALLLALAVLAVILFQMMPAPERDVSPAETGASVEVAQVSEEAPAGEDTNTDGASPAAAEVPSEQPVSEPASETSTKPSEAVEETIQQNFQSARKVFQQKDAIAKASPKEVHHLPKPTLDAAKQLGAIAELEAQHPEQAENFRDFYLECARDEKTITVIRAQCLDKYVKVAKMDAADQKQLLGEFPEEIVRLYEALQ